MISFIFIAAAITLIVIVLLVRPLFKPGQSSSYERQAQNIHFAKERLRELEQQRENAAISDSDYDALKLEIEANLAEDINLSGVAQASSLPDTAGTNGVIIALLCALIPFAALVLYQLTGTPQALQIVPNPVAATSPAPNQQDIETMVGSLEQRLQDNPDDVEGWAMLARTYLALGRYESAIQTNKKLLTMIGENADLYAALADASALQAGGNLAGQPEQYLQQALALNPRHPHALWLTGLSAAQRGNNDNARSYWNTLLPLLADVPEQQNELRKIISQTLDQSPVSQTDTAKESQPAAGIGGITVMVALSESVSALTLPNDLVFVIAKARNGPPAPLAVQRLRVSDLPIEVRLSDADSMMPQFKLSLFDDVLVSARVAKSGNPVAQSGDLQSPAIAAKNNSTAAVELLISEIVK